MKALRTIFALAALAIVGSALALVQPQGYAGKSLLRAANSVSFRGSSEGSPAAWTPASIAGLQLWLDASQITGLNDGDAVATWPDRSGNVRDYTQGTVSARPIYKTNIRGSLPIVRLDGVDDQMSASHTITVKTVVVVFDITGAPPQYAAAAYLAGGSGDAVFYRDTSNTALGTYQSAAGFGPALSGLGSGFLIAIWRFNSSTSNLRVDGVTSGAVAASWTTAFTAGVIGKNGGSVQFLSGDIAHVLYYDTVLTDADCLLLETYLGMH